MIDETMLGQMHGSTTRQGPHLQPSDQMGCFSCEAVFFANAIDQWSSETDEKESAVCPECGQDAVISLYDATKYGLAEHDFIELLNKMKIRWFD